MSVRTVDALFDEPHTDPAETCPNCAAALADVPDPDVETLFAGYTFRRLVANRHEDSIRIAKFVVALRRPRSGVDGVVTYEITEPFNPNGKAPHEPRRHR